MIFRTLLPVLSVLLCCCPPPPCMYVCMSVCLSICMYACLHRSFCCYRHRPFAVVVVVIFFAYETRQLGKVALQPIVPSAKGDRMESRVKMTRMRMRIAERLKSAQNTAAMLTTFQEVRPSACLSVCLSVLSPRRGKAKQHYQYIWFLRRPADRPGLNKL